MTLVRYWFVTVALLTVCSALSATAVSAQSDGDLTPQEIEELATNPKLMDSYLDVLDAYPWASDRLALDTAHERLDLGLVLADTKAQLDTSEPDVSLGGDATGTLLETTKDLPGLSTKWTNEALDLIALLNKYDIGATLLDRFFDAGGIFTREDTDLPSGTQALYNPDDNVIKIPKSIVNADGSLRGVTATMIATIAHEIWHAYRDQVVLGGYDDTTAGILNDAAEWLKKQTLVQANSTKTVVAGTLWSFDEAEFIDEYAGALINDLVRQHIFIKDKIAAGEYDAIKARLVWQQQIKRIKASKYMAYEDADSTSYTVQAAPPVALVDRLIDLFDLGF